MRRKAFVYLVSCAVALSATVLGASAAQAADTLHTSKTTTVTDGGDSWGWD
ncbi:hypothetical protein [Streptomyces sp. NPDC048659]|uniref:hypothetical protein n=1 Tax=Streptomyces sp. NPDC048659 TaxID=3155489 RepID=UPI00342DCDE5